MKRCLLWLMLLLIATISGGCAHKDVVELDISDGQLEALTPIMETGLIGFYTLKESPPENLSGLQENGRLVLCVENIQVVELVKNTPSLFGLSEGILIICQMEQDCGAKCVKTLQEKPQSIAIVEKGSTIDKRKELIEVIFK